MLSNLTSFGQASAIFGAWLVAAMMVLNKDLKSKYYWYATITAITVTVFVSY